MRHARTLDTRRRLHGAPDLFSEQCSSSGLNPPEGDQGITGRASPLPKTAALSLTARLFVGMMLTPIEQHPGFGRCAARLLGGLLRFRLSSSDSPCQT